jgi:hypothetical protein
LITRRGALAAALGLLACAAAQAQEPGTPALDAVVRYETRQVLPSGVKRTESWEERLVRRGNRLWTMRVLPQGSAAVHEHGSSHEGHKHFDHERASRFITRDDRGNLSLRFADPDERMVVSVPSAEYASVGFDGRWDAAAHLVPPSLLKAMKPAEGKAPAGAAWYAQRAQGWTHRVLWSSALQVALRIDSRSDDGANSRTVVLQLQPATPPGKLPWLGLERWTQRSYEDFLD